MWKDKFGLQLIVSVGIVICMSLFLHYTFIGIITVPTGSMEPNVQIGNVLVGTTPFFNTEIHTGDIIVFTPNSKDLQEEYPYLLKRVIGVPGDHIDIKDGVVYINGVKYDESYITNPGTYTGSFVVPQGEYFVMGDNRTNSYDARYWKDPFIKASEIKYVVDFRIFPFNEIGKVAGT